jgi:hypothetical protein
VPDPVGAGAAVLQVGWPVLPSLCWSIRKSAASMDMCCGRFSYHFLILWIFYFVINILEEYSDTFFKVSRHNIPEDTILQILINIVFRNIFCYTTPLSMLRVYKKKFYLMVLFPLAFFGN